MKTGWPPGLLQDDDRKLSRWLASRPDAKYQLRKNIMKEDIIKMAREAGVTEEEFGLGVGWGDLERFAALVEDAQSKRTFDEGFVTVGHMRERIAAEREACAKVAENRMLSDASVKENVAHHTACKNIATAIRARGQA